MSIETLKQALEALELEHSAIYGNFRTQKAITSLRQAIATEESSATQEPVAWVCYGSAGKRDIDFEENDINDLPIGTMLYTHPQPKAKQEPKREPMTDEQVEKIIKTNMSLQINLAGIRQDFAAAHGIKGE